MMLKEALLLLFPVFCLGTIFPEDVAINLVMERYNQLSYPGTEKNPTVVVKHSLSLTNIIEVTKKRIVADVWELMEWFDPRLTWNGQAESIRLPVTNIWTPDITMYSSGTVSGNNQNQAVIHRTGNVFYDAQKRLEINSCISSPDDVIHCWIKFGSWTYDDSYIDVQNRSNVISLSDYQIDPDFDITNSSSVRNIKFYPCCPEAFPVITYTLNLKRT